MKPPAADNIDPAVTKGGYRDPRTIQDSLRAGRTVGTHHRVEVQPRRGRSAAGKTGSRGKRDDSTGWLFKPPPGRPRHPRLPVSAIALCLRVIHDSGVRANAAIHEAVFVLLRRVLPSKSRNGAPVPNRLFATPRVGSKVKHTLTDGEVIICKDSRSWVQTETSPAKAQRFTAAPILAATRGDKYTVKTPRDYTRKRFHIINRRRRKGRFEPCDQSGVKVPTNVGHAMTHGTRLCFDWAKAQEVFRSLPEATRWDTWTAAMRATDPLRKELIPQVWRQVDCGMVFAKGPAVQGLPREFKADGSACLYHRDGRQLYCIDFKHYHLMLFMVRIAEQKIEEGFDYYQDWGDRYGLSRADVKVGVNPIFHGQKWNKILFDPKRDQSKKNRDIILHESAMQIMTAQFPAAMRRLSGGRLPENYFHKLGAQVFYSCLSASLESIGLKYAGIPLHDGWIFPADDADAAKVREAWKQVTADMLGQSLPVEITTL